MIRFRNPISDMNILINNFKKMYVEFSDMDYFDLDHIAEFFAREQLASSSGYIGDEALKRSYQIKDDSRKSMKMQAKSYAELFRFLGWITSGKKALNFNFTFLGMHVALSDEGAKSLFKQCLLGIEYPNHILDVKFSDINKPFVSMLIIAYMLEGKIHRDEILLGPMNISNGYSKDEIDKKVEFIKSLRSTEKLENLNSAIIGLSKENSMQPNSVRNLTRFVMSALEFTGWFKKKRLKIYGTSSVFLVMTDEGKSVAESLLNIFNLKGYEIQIENDEGKELVELSLLCMFKRAQFDVEEEMVKHSKLMNKIFNKSKSSDILFSPYQFFSESELKIVLPQYVLQTGTNHRDVEVSQTENILPIKSNFTVESKRSTLSKNEETSEKLLKLISKSDSNVEDAVIKFVNKVKLMKQTEFYPLVATLLGFVFNKDAYAPSAGNNNMRYDVMIPDDKYSIPVEVKSPTEEEMLSVKAIRQATENKILLLARKPHPTTFEMSSMACGFKVPNDRSDVYKLINEIYDAYKINISILDIETLIRTAFYCALNKSYFELADFENKRGVINFENI